MLKKILIVGGGPAGNAAALAAVRAGIGPVAIVERESFGGTCTNRGCIPTKFLLSRASTPAAAAGEGWRRLVGHKNALVKGLARSIEAKLAAGGVEILKGNAAFVSPHEVAVSGSDGSTARVEAETFVVATGSGPATLPGAARDGERVIDSNDALELASVPASLAVIGSGAVGAEFATIFSRIGVKVTLVEAAERLFPAEDPDVDGVFRRVYERMGVVVHTGDPVEGVERRAEGVAVLLRSGAAVLAERVLVAVGRQLATAGMGLEAAGVQTGPRGGIVVDDSLRTTAAHIHAAGDATGRMLLAHAASFMGDCAARRALGLPAPAVPYGSIPWATFTDPEVGSVGLTVEAAAARGLACRADSLPLMESVKARIDRTTDGFFKVVSEREGGRIVGATVVAPHASDIIHGLALAIHRGMTVSDLRGFCFLHPSLSESIGDLVATI